MTKNNMPHMWSIVDINDFIYDLKPFPQHRNETKQKEQIKT